MIEELYIGIGNWELGSTWETDEEAFCEVEKAAAKEVERRERL